MQIILDFVKFVVVPILFAVLSLFLGSIVGIAIVFLNERYINSSPTNHRNHYVANLMFSFAILGLIVSMAASILWIGWQCIITIAFAVLLVYYFVT